MQSISTAKEQGANIDTVRPGMHVLEVSVKTGLGLDQLTMFLEKSTGIRMPSKLLSDESARRLAGRIEK